MSVGAASVRFPREGEVYEVGPLDIVGRVSAAQTGGAFEMYEVSLGVAAVDFHVHRRMDETIYVLDGEIEFNVTGEKFLRGPGSVAFVPREVHHGFSNRGPDLARVLLVFAPSGDQHEYFRALEGLLGDTLVDKKAIEELQKRYDQELIEPGA